MESQQDTERGGSPTPENHVSFDTSNSNSMGPPSSTARLSRPQVLNLNSDTSATTEIDTSRSPGASGRASGPLSPDIADRVFPIRSVVSRDPNPTPTSRASDNGDGYFQAGRTPRRFSGNNRSGYNSLQNTPARPQQPSAGNSSTAGTSSAGDDLPVEQPRRPASLTREEQANTHKPRQDAGVFNEIAATTTGSEHGTAYSEAAPASHRSMSPKSARSNRDNQDEIGSGHMTARFKHVVSEGGHMVITGRDGDTLQRCEDEPIHIPGAIQGFGLLIALEEEAEGKLVVRVVSENSKRLIGYTPRQLFALDSFTDILSEEQTDNLLDHVDFIRDEDTDVATNGPEVFTMSIRGPTRRSQKLWCAMHINDRNPGLIICEFELEDDPTYPLVPPNDATPEPPEDTLESDPTPQELEESTQNISRPLRVLRSARKRKGEAAAMEVFNIMSQVQEQLAAAPNLEKFLKVLVGVVKELTGFHRVMIYQFDHAWNGRVVTELVDPRATKDLYKGLNFPASDIPKQARELYKINKVRMLYDRDQETARLVCRTSKDLETPLDLTYSYLRAMSPIHLKYLANMAVRSSMSISINAFEELWGLIACHTYGGKGMRVSFPIRKMCRLVGDSASRNIERLSYASRLQARKLINTVPTSNNPSGYIIASSEDLLKLFDADFGLLSIRDETKILGHVDYSQEALAMLEYLRMRRVTNVMTSQDIREDFPDLRYPPGFKHIAGLLLVPLSAGGSDFIVFFRKGQLKEVKWAGNPYEKFVKAGTEGYLEPRKSFKTWSETVVGKCREWTEEEIETAAVLCLVYGKFIEVWRQKEAALQNSQLTRLLLANSAHEVRTPLNAIINYLEIALEGSLDQETRENLAKSHSASKSLIYVINDLLDLTKTEEGGELVKDEVFELHATVFEATDNYQGDARRKKISYEIIEHPNLPKEVIGDQRKVRQAISNITANAIQHTNEGGVTVEIYVASRSETHIDIECSVSDTGVGINAKRLDALFRELEQVHSEGDPFGNSSPPADQKQLDAPPEKEGDRRILGLGLAVVARIIGNMNGQMRLKSEEGKGSRFVLQFPFQLPESEHTARLLSGPSSDNGSETPHADTDCNPHDSAGEYTVIQRDVQRRHSNEIRDKIFRKTSSESIHSKHSLNSMQSRRSNNSQSSQRSEADRLIDAIQEPHMVGSINAKDGSSSRPGSFNDRPKLQRHATSANTHDMVGSRQRSRSTEVAPVSGPVPEHRREIRIGPPGQANLPDSRTPIRSVRIPDQFEGSSPTSIGGFSSAGSVAEQAASPRPQSTTDAKHMRVLIAEDDPVNSRIIKKRLEKLGHMPCLTVNGEECSSAYGEKSGYFDVVLMDMQMPIVDGLTSTKMIRSFEKSHPTHVLSTRASLNGRVPIIAVSASLEERDRKKYVEAGFDGWILKPISFDRLSEIMTGIVDQETRKKNHYSPGKWERGGWFEDTQRDVFSSDTRPTNDVPASGMSQGVKVAAAAEDPAVKEEDESKQSQEQERLLAVQQKQNDDSRSDSTSPASQETEKQQG
ncbi:Histidine protein kinase 1 [Elsinoe australis]|uniref:Histidine protein kinase 1 n=1 Tax=Elsinoe australis TaxID=40998 RepID=A0A2P7YCI2_9PEZI|nr:Histidine protein kinase 1 [Elsinoe australis]